MAIFPLELLIVLGTAFACGVTRTELRDRVAPVAARPSFVPGFHLPGLVSLSKPTRNRYAGTE